MIPGNMGHSLLSRPEFHTATRTASKYLVMCMYDLVRTPLNWAGGLN